MPVEHNHNTVTFQFFGANDETRYAAVAAAVADGLDPAAIADALADLEERVAAIEVAIAEVEEEPEGEPEV